MKNYLSEHVLKNLLVTFGIMITGYLLLVLVYCIPDNMLDKNVRISAEKLYKESNNSELYASGGYMYVNASYISIAVNRKSSNPFCSAIDSYNTGGWTHGVSNLYQSVFENGTITQDLYQSHSRMWDSFRIYLRPLLVRYPIQDIRLLCACMVYALSFVLCMLIYAEFKNFFAVIPFMCAFLFFNFQLEALSLLFFNDICVMMLGCLAVIWFIKCEKDYYLNELFAAAGAVYAYNSDAFCRCNAGVLLNI